MKKLFLLAFAFLFFTVSETKIFANTSDTNNTKKVKWFTPKIQHTISTSLHLNTNTGFHPYPDSEHLFIPSYSLSYFFEMTELYAKTGIHFSAKTFDLTTRAVYGPTFWNCFNVGLGLTYHLLSHSKEFVEQDILVGTFFKYSRGAFTLTTDVNYLFKWTNVYEVYEKIPSLKQHSLALSSTWSWFIIDHLSFYFNMGSYFPYRYMLFWSPSFMTGLQWKFNNGCIIGMDFSLQLIDVLSLTAYLDSAEIRVFTRWIIK